MEPIDKIYQYRFKIRRIHSVERTSADDKISLFIGIAGYKEEKVCLSCGNTFVSYKSCNRKFCCRNCFHNYNISHRNNTYQKTDEFKQKISDSQKIIWEKRRNGELPYRDSSVYKTEEWRKAQSERTKTFFSEHEGAGRKVTKEDEELIVEYYLDFYSTIKIAKIIGVSKTTILNCLKRNHIPRRQCIGEFHPHWKGGRYRDGSKNYGSNWHEIKPEVLRRDNYECQICGKKEGLEVHHITPIRLFSLEEKETKGNDMDNLITLCQYCHRIEHYILRKNELKDVA